MKKLLFIIAFVFTFHTFAEDFKIYPKHPRLLFRDTDLPALKEKVKHEPYLSIFLAMQSWADRQIDNKESIGDMVTFGFLYQMTGEEKYLTEARRRLKAASGYEMQFLSPTFEMKYTYDLIYNGLSKEDRAFFAQKLLKMHMKNPYKPDVMGMHQICNEGSSSLAVWGDEGIDMEMLKARFKKEREAYLGDYFRKANTIAQRWGGWHRSFECRCWRKYVARFAEMWLNATGEDTFDNQLIRSHGAWYLYHTMPGFKDTNNFRIVPDSYTAFGEGLAVNDHENTLILGKRLSEGLSMWWWHQPLSRNQIWGFSAYANFFKTLNLEGLNTKLLDRMARTGIFWRIILYHEKDIEVLHPENFPEDAYHEGMGLVSMRSNWGDQATFAFFHCGRMASGKPDDLDNNNFFIYKNGYLATDGWPNGKTAHYGYEWDNYRRRTIAHNLITVFDPEEPVTNFYSQYARMDFPEYTAGKNVSNDGGQMGQIMYELDPELHPWKEERNVNIYKPNAYIRAFRTTPNYTFIRGDATESYSPHKLKAFTRDFVFLKPDLFIVFDRVVSTDKKFQKTWHIHPMMEPEVNGNQFRWQAYRPKTNYPKREPYPLGWLVGTTLLPEKSHTEVIGGKGKECWVNGKNYHEVREREYYKKQDEADWKHSWRIDVQDPEAKQETHFLHVLETYADTPKEIAKIELKKETTAYIVFIEFQGQKWEVSFPKDGQSQGQIKYSKLEDSTVVLDEVLPSIIEDNYQKWSEDPRHKQWENDPRYRIVVPQE
ncbi:MAG: heparinase II/III family protein [Lentisphaeria bacterium]|nr:heparinase II/III family protein [Lentisphaeria bacterium]